MTSVRLRELTSSDIDWIYEACQDREIQRWTTVPRPYTRDHALEFVSEPVDFFARWVIETVESRRPAGVISIHEVDNCMASIGYWIDSRFRNRGFTSASIRLVCQEIDRLETTTDIEADSVVATIARDNAASRGAVERAGFELLEERHGPAVEDLIVVPTCVYVKRRRVRDHGPPATRTNL